MGEHLRQENVIIDVYLHQWFLKLFVGCFPLETVKSIWDMLVCEGLVVILRVAAAIFMMLKTRLLSMRSDEIHTLFKFMEVFPQQNSSLKLFQSQLLERAERVKLPPLLLAYLSDMSHPRAELDIVVPDTLKTAHGENCSVALTRCSSWEIIRGNGNY